MPLKRVIKGVKTYKKNVKRGMKLSKALGKRIARKAHKEGTSVFTTRVKGPKTAAGKRAMKIAGRTERAVVGGTVIGGAAVVGSRIRKKRKQKTKNKKRR